MSKKIAVIFSGFFLTSYVRGLTFSVKGRATSKAIQMKRAVTEEMRNKYWGKNTAEKMIQLYPGSKGLAAMKQDITQQRKRDK